MKCQNYNFVINRGATKVVNVVYTDAQGNVKDLSAYNARMQFREFPESETVDLSLNSITATPNNSIINITPSSGSIDIYITAAESAGLTKDMYFYDLEIYTGSDPYGTNDPEFVIRILEGTAITKYNITR